MDIKRPRVSRLSTSFLWKVVNLCVVCIRPVWLTTNSPPNCQRNMIELFLLGIPLQWRHNGRDGVSNHQPNDCLLNRLFRRISKKTSKLRVTGICAGNSPVTGEFLAQMARNAENVSIWWPLHANFSFQWVAAKEKVLVVHPFYWDRLPLWCWLHTYVFLRSAMLLSG